MTHDSRQIIFAWAITAALAISGFATTGVAVEGKLEGFGPLRLGMSEAELARIFGDSKEEYSSRLKIGFNTFHVFIGFQEKTVRSIALVADPSIDTVPVPNSTVRLRGSDNAIRSNCETTYSLLQRIGRTKWGTPDYVGHGLDDELLTQWFFPDGSYVKVHGVLRRNNELHCDTGIVLIRALSREEAEPVILPAK